MSSVHTHIAGKLVRRFFETGRGGQRGPWWVKAIGAQAILGHYATEMLAFDLRGNVTVLSVGHGSVSDQSGINAALWALGSSMRYSRDIRGGGPRVNRRRR